MRMCAMELELHRAEGVRGKTGAIFVGHNLCRCVVVGFSW